MIAVSEPRPCAISASKNAGLVAGEGASLLPHPIIRMEIGLPVMSQPARVAVDHRFEVRAALLDRDQLVDLLLVLDNRQPHLGVIEDIGHLVGDRVLVERHRNAAQCLRCRDRPIEPRPVVADDRDLVAAPETEPLQPAGQLLDLFGDLGPVPALPDAVILLAHGGAVGTLAGMRQQQFRKGVGQTGAGSAAGRGRKLRRGSCAARHLANTRGRDFLDLRSLMRLCRIGRKGSSGSTKGLIPRNKKSNCWGRSAVGYTWVRSRTGRRGPVRGMTCPITGSSAWSGVRQKAGLATSHPARCHCAVSGRLCPVYRIGERPRG